MMTGAPVIGAWIAHIVFWAVLGLGFLTNSLSVRAASIFATLWVVGYVLLSRLGGSSGVFVAPYVAVLDVALVLAVFKGDVRLS